MKKTFHTLCTLAAFAGVLIFSSSDKAGAFSVSPVLQLQPKPVSLTLKDKPELRNPSLLPQTKKSSARSAADPYLHLLKTSRLLSTSA